MLVKRSQSRLKNSSLPFEIEQESLRYKVGKDRAYTLLFAGLAITCPIASLVFKTSLTPDAIACILGFGTINSGILLWAIQALEKPEKYLTTFEKANTEALKKAIAYDINYTLTLGKINAQRQLAYQIETLPKHEHSRWINMLGLGGILPPAIKQTAVLESKQTEIEPNHFVNADSEDIEELVQDFDYLELSNKQLVLESKAVFGNKGSGKSSYLAYEALQFCSQFPNGKLFIGDIHYDSEDSKWLPYLDEETLTKKVVASTSANIFKIIKALDQTLKDRKAAGLKITKPGCFPIKFIWDEVLGTLDEWDEHLREFAVKALEKIQFEGRKYGLEVTLGLHSLKKGKTDFDSSFFNNLTILALGTAIADNTIRYPSDFNIPELLAELDNVNALLPVQVDDNGQNFYPKGLGCVIRRRDKKPCIKVIPSINLPSRLEYARAKQQDEQSTQNKFIDGVEAIAYISQWASEIDTPTDAQIRDKWLEITGNYLDDEGLNYLKHMIG